MSHAQLRAQGQPLWQLRDLVPVVPGRRPRPWQTAYVWSLVAVDALSLVAAVLLCVTARSSALITLGRSGLAEPALIVVATLAWLVTLALSGCYDRRALGHGTDEYKRVCNALARYAAVAGIFAYGSRLQLPRSVLAGTLVGTGLLAASGRAVARHVLRTLRRHGIARRQVLVLGTPDTAFPMAARLARDSTAGFRVVGLCSPGGRDRRSSRTAGRRDHDRRRPCPVLPVVAGIDDVVRVVRENDIDTVAVAPSPAIPPDVLRQLAWDLEDSAVELIVASALVDVAGPRIHVSPVAGLPLLHLSTPRLTGVRYVVKSLQDRLVALLAICVLSPVLLVVALLVRLDSPGYVLFRQIRVGQGGRTFRMYKFRSMYVDAEARLAEVAAANVHRSGPLFKVVEDPRVTRVGRVLRKWSLDELPQLINILKGEMSIVGPRPALVDEVLAYDARHVYRRLMVKPGLTGLWQVSGRADLPWHEAVRLDLYYVENWSPSLDASIVWRTVGAVLAGRGAY